MLTLITAIANTNLETLQKKARVIGYNNIGDNSNRILKFIKRFINEHVGYNETPIACMLFIDEEHVKLEKDLINLSDYISMKRNNIYIELELRNDLVVSMNFEDFLDMSQKYEHYSSDIVDELLYEELEEKIHVGNLKGCDVISFIPHIDYKFCRKFALINDEWESEDISIGNIPRVHLEEMKEFEE